MPEEVPPPFESCEVRVDDKGRMSMIPAFRRAMAAHSKWFVCSLDGEIIRMYPAEEWQRVKGTLQSQGPGGLKVISFAERHGIQTELDAQGRILIPRPLFGVIVRTQFVWLYWRDGHILVLKSEQHDERQRYRQRRSS